MINCYFNTDVVLVNTGSFLTLVSIRRLSSLTFFSNYSETFVHKVHLCGKASFFLFSQLLDNYSSGMIDPNETGVEKTSTNLSLRFCFIYADKLGIQVIHICFCNYSD